jgi:creatinine amidohydrolase
MQQILDELAPNSQATLVATTYVTEAGEDLSKHLQDQPGVMHAGEAETSMMLVCEPELVDLSDIAKIASPKLDSKFLSAGQGSYRWRPFSHATQNGLAGNPARSTAEKGKKVLEAGASALARLITDPETWLEPNYLRSSETGGVLFCK